MSRIEEDKEVKVALMMLNLSCPIYRDGEIGGKTSFKWGID
jgi:hypothetical protein